MESVDHAAVTDGETQVDQLLSIEVCAERGEHLVGDWFHTRTQLRKAHDQRFGLVVDPFGKRIVAKVSDLLIGESDVSTETNVCRYSIVTVVGHRSGQIRELALRGVDEGLRRRLRSEMEERLEAIRVVRQRA